MDAGTPPVDFAARDGDPEPIDFEETDANYAIGWKGNYSIEGRAFVYTERKSGRIITILGYPTAKIAQLVQIEKLVRQRGCGG
jgi:hypothetical protein